MNSRLHTQYEEIEHANLQSFLNNEVSIDTNWGKNVFGVTMQIDLDEGVKDAMAKHIKNLIDIEPESLLFSDRSAQHISFNQVVQWNLGTQEENRSSWEKIKGIFIPKFLSYNQKISKFAISFKNLIATTGGIIWCASDENEEMQDARELLLKDLPKPAVIPKPAQIIHTTIARYMNKLRDPQAIMEYTKKDTILCKMEVNKILLREELIYPTLSTYEIASIGLI